MDIQRPSNARAKKIRRIAYGTVAIDRKSTRLNSSHLVISYAVFCLKKKNHTHRLFHKLAGVATAASYSLNQSARITVYLPSLAHFAPAHELIAQYVREPFPARAAVRMS